MKSGGDCIVIMRLKIIRGSIPLMITWDKTTGAPILALRGMSCQVPLPARAGPRQVLILSSKTGFRPQAVKRLPPEPEVTKFGVRPCTPLPRSLV